MHGLLSIVEACEAARDAGRRGVLATVVRVAGSAYRRPGARMFLIEGGPPVGLVSGGCLEEDLAERAVAVLADGRPETVVYDMRSPDDIVWGLGLGCDGEVRVLLERIAPDRYPAYLRFIRDCERDRTTAVVATVFDSSEASGVRPAQRVLVSGDRQVVDHGLDRSLSQLLLDDAQAVLRRGSTTVRRYDVGGQSADVLLEHLAPTPQLLLFGAGDDALPVARMARQLGWRVALYDHRPAYADPSRFPDVDAIHNVRYEELDSGSLPIDRWTAVVVMTHHFVNDRTLLPLLLGTAAPYIGLLGPKKRAMNLLEGVASDPSVRDRVFGPVGLDIGSETPEEIALSLLAEIQAVFAGRRGGFLRDRDRPLHDPVE